MVRVINGVNLDIGLLEISDSPDNCIGRIYLNNKKIALFNYSGGSVLTGNIDNIPKLLDILLEVLHKNYS